jgi:UDP-N-acetylglucosamine acyltransferase
MYPRVHPTSIIDRHAELHEDVEVGPFCHVHAGVRIGSGTRLISHVVVLGNTTIGTGNVFHPFSVIGGEAQVRKGLQHGAPPQTQRRATRLEIGDHNVFRESVTVSVSSGNGTTLIGSHNLFMAGSHVAHDVCVGSRCVIANAVQLAGHVVVEDWVTFGGLAGIAQHLCVGQGAFVAAGAMCERDVPPFVIVQGDRARVRALNVVGLGRRSAEIPPTSVAALRHAFARLWGRSRSPSSSGFDECIGSIDRSDPWVAILIDWLSDPLRRIRAAKRPQSSS